MKPHTQEGKTRITIITVVFNGVKAIESTINSVLALQDIPVDYLVIDGGSTDGTISILEQHDRNITYWVSEKDRGIYDAMNKGWQVASEESFVLFLGAGDRILSLPKALASYEDTDVIYGIVEQQNVTFKSKVDFRLRMTNTLHHQGMLVRRSVHPNPPFDVRFPTYADFDFNQRLYRSKARFSFSKDLIASVSPGGVSSKHYMLESLSVVRKNYGIFWGFAAAMYYIGYYAARPGGTDVTFKNTTPKTIDTKNTS